MRGCFTHVSLSQLPLMGRRRCSSYLWENAESTVWCGMIPWMPKGTLPCCKIKSDQVSVPRRMLRVWFSHKMAPLHILLLSFMIGWMATSLGLRWVVVGSHESWPCDFFLRGWLKKQLYYTDRKAGRTCRAIARSYVFHHTSVLGEIRSEIWYPDRTSNKTSC